MSSRRAAGNRLAAAANRLTEPIVLGVRGAGAGLARVACGVWRGVRGLCGAFARGGRWAGGVGARAAGGVRGLVAHAIAAAASWYAVARREVLGLVHAVGPARWRHVGAAAATGLTAAVLCLTWLPDNTWAGTVPSTAQTVGTCHAYNTQSEAEAFSDVRPPVPCDTPHQAETVLTGQLTGTLAGPNRMTPEQRLLVTGQLCPDAAIRQYVGARPRDELYSVQVQLRLPTQREWAAGARGYRCELAAYDPTDPLRIPSLTTSLRDILNTPAGARVRHCWAGFTTAVTCDRPHDSESVLGITDTPQWIVNFGAPSGFDPAQYAQFQQWAAGVCGPSVTQFLGRPVSATPDHIDGHLSLDARVLWCSVAFPASQPLTSGSIAREYP